MHTDFLRRPRGRAALMPPSRRALVSLLTLALALAPRLAAPPPAFAAEPAAPPPPPRGNAPLAAGHWDLGADVVFSTVEPAHAPGGFELDQTAHGLGLRAGRRLCPDWRLQAAVSLSRHDTVTPEATLQLTRATVEIVRLFRAGHQLRPWLLAGGGYFHVGTHRSDLVCAADGAGATLAGGWELRLSPRLALQGAARAEAVRWLGGPAQPVPLFDRWEASSQVSVGITISM